MVEKVADGALERARFERLRKRQMSSRLIATVCLICGEMGIMC
jgi:hypothetical protein